MPAVFAGTIRPRNPARPTVNPPVANERYHCGGQPVEAQRRLSHPKLLCRNRRNFMDDATRRAVEGENDIMLVAYRMNLGEGRYRPVKNMLVPVFVQRLRYGNFELAYADEAED